MFDEHFKGWQVVPICNCPRLQTDIIYQRNRASKIAWFNLKTIHVKELKCFNHAKQVIKDICKRDLQAHGINTDSWEVTATDRDTWRHTVKVGLSQYEETQRVKAEEKKLHQKAICLANRPITAFTCSKCGRDCPSPIGLRSDKRRCTVDVNLWM